MCPRREWQRGGTGGGRMTDRPRRGTHPGKPSRIDTSTAHSARIYNYWLGGKDNFPADREAAEAAMAANPGIVADVRANRAFLARAVRYLVAEAGVRQFLDIGTGLPTADNTHEVAQAVAPESRIVYVDNDPLVLVHARIWDDQYEWMLHARRGADLGLATSTISALQEGRVPKGLSDEEQAVVHGDQIVSAKIREHFIGVAA